MQMINVLLEVTTGRVHNIILPDNFVQEDFIKAVSKTLKTSVDGLRFVLDGKQLDLENDSGFNEEKAEIIDGKTIFVLERFIGGACSQISVLVDEIVNKLPTEFAKIRHTNNTCVVCLDEQPCLQLCCTDNPLCDICFTTHFISNNFRLFCMNCKKSIPIEKFFVGKDFLILLRSLDGLDPLLKNIDCQICECGLLLINDTLYPKQTCRCGRIFCFFCNKVWDDKTMCNISKYTCHNNCFYETCITFELVKFKYSSQFLVPDRRCCPKCFNMGAYGDQCKFHTCRFCKYKFCFLCLRAESECPTRFSVACGDPVRQNYSIFPHINGK